MELLDAVLAYFAGNVTTAIFFGVVYLNVVLFKDYIWTLLWSFVISQALYSSKTRLVKVMTTLSREEETRPVLSVVWEMATRPYRSMYSEGKPNHAMVFRSLLDWCIELFAVVGLMSLTSRLVSVWLLVVAVLAMVPLLVVLFFLDRRIFLYRRVVSDDVLASVLVIAAFFASVCFIGLFLGLESALEGISAGQRMSSWIQSMLDDDANASEWSKQTARLTDFAHKTALGLESQYNETVWFPVARNAVMYYMEHGTLMMTADPSEEEPTITIAASGFMGAGGFSSILGTVQEHISDLEISIEHVVNYGRPSGKIIASGATFLAALASLLVTVGFKVVLFFTCVLYMTSHDGFLERSVGDLLPIAKVDRQAAVDILRRAIQGVFFLPCKVACLHGVVTLISFTLLNVEFPFFAAFMAVVVSILPVVPAYVVCWPWAVTLVMQGRWVGFLLALSQHLVLSAIDRELCTQGVREANPYLTGLSSFLGFAVFGAQGVLLGPLIVCMATFIYSGLGFLKSSTMQPLSSQRRAGGHRAPMAANIEGQKASEKGNAMDYDGAQHRTSTGQFGAGLRHTERSGPGSVRGAGSRAFRCSGCVDNGDCNRLEIKTFDPQQKVRVTLRVKASPHPSLRPDQSEKQEEGQEGERADLSLGDGGLQVVGSMWRLDAMPTWTWETFLLEVQDVMGIEAIEGIYDKDGCRIRRVSFIDDGESLDVLVLGKSHEA